MRREPKLDESTMPDLRVYWMDEAIASDKPLPQRLRYGLYALIGTLVVHALVAVVMLIDTGGQL